MRCSRTTALLLAAASGTFALALSPPTAAAQPGIGQRLAPPSGERGPAPEVTLDRVDPSELEVPEPPGHGDVPAAPDEIRYPIPTPEVTGAQPDEPSIRIPSRITTRLRAIDANLRTLSARSGGNIVNAVLSMLTGGLSVTLGAFAPEPMSWYLYVYGGVAAARGVLDLVLTPNASGAAITYQHMPMTDDAEVQRRLEYGERALAGLAEQALIARVVDASLNMAAGVAVVPLYLAPNDFEINDPLAYFVMIGAGVSIVSGVITLASTSAEEQRWQAYEQLRDRLEAEHREESGEVDRDLATLELRRPLGPTVRPGFGSVHVAF